MREYSIAIGSYAPVGYPAIYKTNCMLENIQRAYDFGYGGVEWHLKCPEQRDIAQVTKLCGNLGMPITSIGTGMACAYDGLSLMHPEKDVQQKAIARLKEFIDMGTDLKAAVIIGSMKGNMPKEGDTERYTKILKDNLSAVMDYAEKKDVLVVLEVINRYESNFLNTAVKMDAFIQEIGSDMLKAHLDTFHMNIEERDIGESIRSCRTLGHMHYADSNRWYPGAGHIDFQKIEQTLDNIGYEGIVAIECLPEPEPDIAAKKAIEYLEQKNNGYNEEEKKVNWEQMVSKNTDVEDFKNTASKNFDQCGIYPESIQQNNNTVFFIVRDGNGKTLVLFGSNEYFQKFSGKEQKIGDADVKICELNHENCEQIRSLFPYTSPVSHGSRPFSLGMGDRLGIASPGHIRLIRDMDVFPILAQQSMRELNLTGRTYPGVLDDASWAVFQEGYTKGFGADADHLKTKEEVQMGLDCGYSMITLDCSEHIANTFFDTTDDQLKNDYEKLPTTLREEAESTYLSNDISIDNGTTIKFSELELMRCVLVYKDTLSFIDMIYRDVITVCARKIDFEISIDETTVPTTPEAHYYIASQLKMMGIKAESVAPRFCGEFQKGIDYIGDLKQFENELIVHAKIAEHFGYRLSIHSGSDKFSVFPIIGKYTQMNVHVKTAGTNWLEAVRLIAANNPGLYRRMHKFALEKLEDAKKYYHISGKPENIPDINKLDDSQLPCLMDKDDSRQLLHITYGLLLSEKDDAGKYVFKDEIYTTLHQFENKYYENLIKHIGKHVEELKKEGKND